MSIRVGMRGMGRPPMGVPPPPGAIFTEGFDWKEEPPTFTQIFTEVFTAWEYTDGHLMPPMEIIFSESFSGWP